MFIRGHLEISPSVSTSALTLTSAFALQKFYFCLSNFSLKNRAFMSSSPQCSSIESPQGVSLKKTLNFRKHLSINVSKK